MANYGTYSSLSEIKAALGIASTDTADDARLLQALETASRWIDEQTGRHFSVRTETRYFTANRSDRLLIPDLLAVTTLKTLSDNSSGTRTYGDVWATTDYDLEPYNEWPKWAIEVNPSGAYSFPSDKRGIEIAGQWGFGDGQSATPYEDSTTDTAEALDTTETGVDAVSGAVLSAGQTIRIDSEDMYVTAVATNTATVRRGVNGTTAAAHDTGKDIYIYRYHDDIEEACRLRASQLLYGANAPLNIMGTVGEQAAFSPSMLYARMMDLINPLRRISVG